jgi:hypothetical protein
MYGAISTAGADCETTAAGTISRAIRAVLSEAMIFMCLLLFGRSEEIGTARILARRPDQGE